MFRRRDELTDSANPTSASAAPAANGASHAQEASAPATATAAAASPTAPASSYNSHTPTASTAPARTPTADAAARPAASAPAGSYRSSPIAEFNRTIARSASEPARGIPAASASFNTASEKNAPAAKSSRRVLTVGNDILLKGEIATCDRLVIEGRVEAKLSEVHTVEIAECGSFKGTAEVEDAEISGIFEGDLIVRNRIVIYASGEVRGNISYGEIEIERGGRLTGQIKTVASNAAAGKAKLDTAESKRSPVKETVAA